MFYLNLSTTLSYYLIKYSYYSVCCLTKILCPSGVPEENSYFSSLDNFNILYSLQGQLFSSVRNIFNILHIKIFHLILRKMQHWKGIYIKNIEEIINYFVFWLDLNTNKFILMFY